jgi:hypothetical protein
LARALLPTEIMLGTYLHKATIGFLTITLPILVVKLLITNRN